jgi:signal transduction histidine kinase
VSAGRPALALRVANRLPLRTRVMVAFGLVALLVTSLLSLLTWNLATGYMLDQREHSAIQQAVVNAQLVEAALARGSGGLSDLLAGLGAEAESAVLLVDDGDWITSRNLVDPAELPDRLRVMAENGQSAHQRVELDGVPLLAIGLPLPSVQATYVEVIPMRELDGAFRYLSWMLCAGTLVSGLAGALLGRWATTHALRPLSELTAAAARAVGDLTVRLPTSRDPDLAPLAAAFNETAERLQQRVARDNRFAGDVSHELRSPLTTMLNAMSVLHRRRAELPPNAAKAVDLLGTDLRRFRRMVDDLLEISRADHGDQLAMEQVDLAELVDEVVAGRPDDRACPVTIEGPPPQVLADRRRLERAIANLFDNAERHGGGLVRVAVLGHDGRARVEVDDAGPGVPPEHRDRIFERFARGSPADRDDSDTGAGLGLALVNEHVRRHHGRAWVEDRPGGGARFVIELPQASG